MSKICKQNTLLCLTCSLGMASCDINRKQNLACCFQTVNLSFSSRKRPTFASKVARFLSANSRLIVWIKKECFSDHKLAALTFGSDILCCRIFRFAQQLVHIRQNNSLVVSGQLVGADSAIQCLQNNSLVVLLFSFNQRYKSTMQMCRRICAPPEISIRIFNPLSSFFLFNDSMMQIDV